jgi:hypothetical protein
MSDERLELQLPRRHRTVAALLGFAVGDAYGVAVGRGEEPFSGPRAEVSDATQTMLACCEGLLRCFVRAHVGLKQPTPEGMVWPALRRWAAAQGDMDLSFDAYEESGFHRPAWLSEQPVMRVRNRHGSALAKALASGPGKTGSAGSAALFRVAPVSLLAAPGDPEDAVRSVVALTHDAPGALLAAVALHRIIRETFMSESSERSLHERIVFVAEGLKADLIGLELGTALSQAIATDPFSPPKSMPAHTAQGTLVRAVRAAAHPESLPVVLANVTAGRTHDVTSLGAITGLLASLELAREVKPNGVAVHEYAFGSGTQLVPPDWLERLVGREVVERMAADLRKIAVSPWPVHVDADIVTRYPGL